MLAGRLKPAATIAEAEASLDSLACSLAETYPETDRLFTLAALRVE